MSSSVVDAIGHVSADHDITLKPVHYFKDWNFICCFGHSLNALVRMVSDL